MSFFFLFTQQQKERKSTKKKEKPKLCSNILTSIHSFGCVSMFGYTESLQPRKLGHSPQAMLGKKLIQIFIHPHPPYRHLLPSREKDCI